ncbi:MAG: RNA polymerase sigma factor [Clostridiales bacterium]
MLLFTFLVEAKQDRSIADLDEDLIIRIGNDDKEAFQEFYFLTHRPLFAYILSYTGNYEDAEDILQDTYLKIRSAAHLYQKQGKPMAWVFTVSRNLALMNLRSKKRVSNYDIDQLKDNVLLSVEMDEDDRLVLQLLLEKLEEKERSVILLHSVCGYKFREIGQSLEMPLATVLSKYHRGLKKLKSHLLQQNGGQR